MRYVLVMSTNYNCNAPALVYSTKRIIRDKRTYVGGFADRMKGVVSTYLLAKLSGRQFFLDWEWPTSIDHILAPSQVSWRMPTGVMDSKSNSVFDLIDAQASDAKLATISEGGDALNEYFNYSDVVTVYCNGYLFADLSKHAGTLTSYSVDMRTAPVCFKSVFDALFVFQPSGRSEIQYEEFVAFKRGVDFLYGAQFRTGGSGSWKDPELDAPQNCVLMAKQIIERAEKRNQENIGVFLTTDSQLVKTIMKECLPANIRLFYYNDEPAHLDRSEFSEAKRISDQLVVENTALSECDEIFIGKGAFGRIAAYRAGRNAIRYDLR